MNFERRIRQIETQTGCTIEVSGQWTEGGKFITAHDPELDTQFRVSIRLASQGRRALSDLHNMIYRARGQEVYRRQGGRCAMCGDKIREFEIDHIKKRSKGRDDRLSNLQAVGPSINHACHREKHGG